MFRSHGDCVIPREQFFDLALFMAFDDGGDCDGHPSLRMKQEGWGRTALTENQGKIRVYCPKRLRTSLCSPPRQGRYILARNLMVWTAHPDGIAMCQAGAVVNQAKEGAAHMTITILGIDLAKSVFQLHGVDATGCIVLKKTLRRGTVLAI